jgi:hypothetical protein
MIMDPSLINPEMMDGLPAPLWFIQLFKVIGFTLHLVPMNLWYAGILIAMLGYTFGCENGKRFSRRLMRQMPVIVAYGVNFGIVPLLFVQVAYFMFFYPATVLIAWHWIAIVVLLIPAYYGVYYYAFGIQTDEQKPSASRVAAGWLAAILFIGIGVLFVNGFTAMVHVDRWGPMWADHSVAGATLGTASNFGDATFLPRWLLLFGLAIETVGVWLVFDAAWFGGKESDEYKDWAPKGGLVLTLIGALWFAGFSSWYVFGTWDTLVYDRMFRGGLIVLTLLTGLMPGVPVVMLFFLRGKLKQRGWATFLFLAQFGVLAINAISRQVVQNLEAGMHFDIWNLPEKVQWSPLLVFLGAFVVGLLVIVWMVAQVVKASKRAA